MKLSVTKGFIDKDTNVFHNVGEVVEYPEKRAKEIEIRGFGRILEPKPTKAEKEPEKVVEKKTETIETPKIEQPKKIKTKK